MKRAAFFTDWFTVCAMVFWAGAGGSAVAQEVASPLPTPPGQTVFGQHCASCHTNPSTTNRAPDLTTLMKLTPEKIYTAVTAGSMVVPAQPLSDEQKRQVAEYLGGRPLDLTETGSAEKMANRCVTNPDFRDRSGTASWNGWGADRGNTRSQNAQDAGLTADQVPQLKLKWAFGFPGGDTVYGQPSVVAGRVFVGSDNGYVYSLDAKTGCVYWSFHARSGVRTAPVVAPIVGLGSETYAVYVGDMRANAYALDASTGQQLWIQELSDHYTARITAAPALYQGRLYVPISATEEAFSAAPSYPCCTFRGSVVALDANTGKQLWRTYAISEAPRPVRKNSLGTALWAPAGAAIWDSPTIDTKRGVLYVGTGDAYTEPASKNSDAVLAIDLTTGKILWSFQAVPNDAWMVGCVPKPTENCPKDLGVDFDFGSSPILLNLASGQPILLATPKSGTVFALDPDRQGAVLWSVNLSETTAPNNGQIAFGGAADSERLYLALEDGTFAALELASGKRAWITRLESLDNLGRPTSNGENRTKGGLRFGQSAAVTAIPGAVFTGGWDGTLRALSTADGRVLWQFDTVQEFHSMNGVPAKGGSMGGPGVTIVNGILYAPSGYANVGGGMPGNVLLAFALP
ncbi:MAG TPA: PQQ-binding-like beta-propeller repeat protein [Candidatus Acidoferrales bacterium]|nr:PQQ-binding-like beta-propeller repeat protein [Candidatus Acidoferrales bacterium]